MPILSDASIGSLYIVATPIGNRDDVSMRAIKTLQTVDLILAEDTRHSKQLLSALGIHTPIQSFHTHNESQKSNLFLGLLQQGQHLALISDAGTPLISDPGYPLVQLAHHHQIPVIPIPGPCALIAALSAAGVPCSSFTFIGFLPAKSSQRQQKLQAISTMSHTLVCYESTHRITESLQDIALILGNDCPLVLAKELTKSFERIISGTPTSLLTWLASDSAHVKGEFVIIIPPRNTTAATDDADKILPILLAELPLKQAVTIACQLTGLQKNELYAKAIQLKKT